MVIEQGTIYPYKGKVLDFDYLYTIEKKGYTYILKYEEVERGSCGTIATTFSLEDAKKELKSYKEKLIKLSDFEMSLDF